MERARTNERGFTLIELMVVVLIIAVLVGVGLPSLLGARSRAHDAAAQALIRSGLSAEIVHYGSAQEFTDDLGILGGIEPDMGWGTLAASDKGVTVHVTGSNQVAILRSESGTGTIFCLARIANLSDAGTYYTTGCDGTEARAAVAGWPSTVATGW